MARAVILPPPIPALLCSGLTEEPGQAAAQAPAAVVEGTPASGPTPVPSPAPSAAEAAAAAAAAAAYGVPELPLAGGEAGEEAEDLMQRVQAAEGQAQALLVSRRPSELLWWAVDRVIT